VRIVRKVEGGGIVCKDSFEKFGLDCRFTLGGPGFHFGGEVSDGLVDDGRVSGPDILVGAHEGRPDGRFVNGHVALLEASQTDVPLLRVRFVVGGKGGERGECGGDEAEGLGFLV